MLVVTTPNRKGVLKGLGPRIVTMRDVEGKRFEEIAVLLGVSVTSIRDAYNREKKKAPTGDTEGATNHPEDGLTIP